MFGKRDFVEGIVRELGFHFYEGSPSDYVEVVESRVGLESLPREIGRIWWKDSDGSVVRCHSYYRFEGLVVDLVDPGSLDVIRNYFVVKDSDMVW